MFALHPRLVRATAPLGDLALCRALLLDDRRYPWLLLVPRRDGVEEIAQLAQADRHLLIDEVALASTVLQRLYRPFRLNVADIGNKAEQLHVHLVARFQDDPAWPAVVWSRPYERYQPAALAERRRELIAGFVAAGPFTPHAEHGVA